MKKRQSHSPIHYKPLEKTIKIDRNQWDSTKFPETCMNINRINNKSGNIKNITYLLKILKTKPRKSWTFMCSLEL